MVGTAEDDDELVVIDGNRLDGMNYSTSDQLTYSGNKRKIWNVFLRRLAERSAIRYLLR